MIRKAQNRHASFHGTWLHSSRVNGFVLSETVCAPGLELARHSHEHAGFCVVLQGGFVEHRERKERLYQPSDIIFRPPGALHANHFLSVGGRCLNIEITAESLQRLGERAAVFNCPADFRGGFLSTLATRLHRELQQTDALSSLAIETLALELLIEAARDVQPLRQAPRWLARVVELLRERFAEPLTLTEIASAVNVHPAHLARTFRRFHRQTVGDYLRQLRLEFARAQLAASTEPISAIALAAGFYDQCHFSRAFKRHTGITPAEFRAAIRTHHFGTKLQS
jgi:AraC family transcriptional regulator